MHSESCIEPIDEECTKNPNLYRAAKKNLEFTRSKTFFVAKKTPAVSNLLMEQ